MTVLSLIGGFSKAVVASVLKKRELCTRLQISGVKLEVFTSCLTFLT